ncbi:MAG TPA: crossover junction endodeoxyribonuclease RuvC [Beutenbergiaceae bacterium]|nr:crossover junction endodeoxyribonuclease RuvC [Beutenbergiaceae bacterium]
MTFSILGVDPGLTRCGIGVIEAGPGRRVRLVEVDVIRTAADAALSHRLADIDKQLGQWVQRFQPDAVAVEQVFAQHNVRTVTGTAQVAGLAMVAATRAGIPVATHTPSEIKAAVTGNGRAPKEQVQEMVRQILQLSTRPRPADAADALALAITHAWRRHVTGVPGSGPVTAAQRAWAQADVRARAVRGYGGRAASRARSGPVTR